MTAQQQAKHTLAALSSLYRVTPLPGTEQMKRGPARGPRFDPGHRVRPGA